MKHSQPDQQERSLNATESLGAGQRDDAFGGRHGGRENFTSVAGEENLTPKPKVNQTKSYETKPSEARPAGEATPPLEKP